MFPRLIVPWTNARGPACTESYAAKNSAATHARAPGQAGTWSAHFLSTPGCIFGSLSMGCGAGAILDSYKPVHYGPPDFGGGYCRDLAKTDAGVESMADDAREKGDREQPLDNEAALSTRLKRLGEQLGHVHPDRRSEGGTNQRRATDPSAIARGFRLSTELVAGVLVGAALGWVVDRWLGISPWGMIVFLLLGFAAGVLNVMRAAGVAPTGPLDRKQ